MGLVTTVKQKQINGITNNNDKWIINNNIVLKNKIVIITINKRIKIKIKGSHHPIKQPQWQR
jgi:hypothetical protein